MMRTRPQHVALLALLREREGHTEVLLGRKIRGFGQGKIVLPGGKLEAGESAAQAAIREFREETGLRVRPEDLVATAQINFRFPAWPAADMECAAFIASRASGTEMPTEELEPIWVDPSSLPVQQMWQDSPLWLPKLAAGENFTAEVVLGEDNESVHSLTFLPWP